MDDKERFTAWLEIEEKYRLLEEEWRNHRRGITDGSKQGAAGRETDAGAVGGTEAEAPDAGNLPAPITNN